MSVTRVERTAPTPSEGRAPSGPPATRKWHALPFCRPVCRTLDDPRLDRWSLALLGALGAAGHMLAPLEHRGQWRLCRGVGKLLGRRFPALTLKLDEDSSLRIETTDAYWLRTLTRSYCYEESLARVLERAPPDYTFIDCGANLGYWSILASGRRFGCRPTLAIEAFEPTFRQLQLNAEANGHRFRAIHRALGRESGRRVRIDFTGDHASAQVSPTAGPLAQDVRSPDAADDARNWATTISLDDAIAEHFDPFPSRVVVKLDVEGQEINALEGAARLMRQDALVYYEDHGADMTHKVTKFVRDELGCAVYYVDSTSARRILDDGVMTRIKKQSHLGYNFFACRPGSGFAALLESFCS